MVQDEIKIRRWTKEELEERARKEAEREFCFFCGRKPTGHAAEHGASRFSDWVNRPVCSYCLGQTFSYYDRNFSDRIEGKKYGNRWKDFMQKEMDDCTYLTKLVAQLKREAIAAFR